ncbi:hypothetical protein ILUMI_19444 [Ignelater luminosus]|uniref:MULE transposase domain-containing protein n=1 Tax=Ignelater luminosus TaxID=2038154 RepID=A0A8K0CI70_IGNLU|nr:hypothetical protein ILUMI_19444 [Ignelater luminosus]
MLCASAASEHSIRDIDSDTDDGFQTVDGRTKRRRHDALQCKIYTRDGEVIKQLNYYSHCAFAVDVEVATAVTSVKRRAEAAVENPAQGVEDNFLQHDSGQNDDNRILIFGRESRLQHLQTSQNWFVMTKKLGGAHPIFYALSSNKHCRTYVQMFQAINDLKDFEQAAIAATSECFAEMTINGCFFHLGKNMKKRLAEMGFTALYNDDPDFAFKAKMVLSLVFVAVTSGDP